ncbi:MAG: anthranilate phosphoribosyltransferase [Verrucomicrobiales bacterium]|nr:anthranilate phosphoribosyltransferase [Verrucomicrobiales bacterium]
MNTVNDPLMKPIIAQLESGHDLSAQQVNSCAEFLLDEAADIGEKAQLLKALSGKGETPAEIAAFVEAFLEHAVDPGFAAVECTGPTIDVCGTGGDKLDLFNISTTSVFVIAGGGACVVKHGNRGITSKSGGADVLEALGIAIDLPTARLRECVLEHSLGFLFAPIYHPAFKAVVPVRKQLATEGVRTVFNLIGPLLNPVRPDYQMVGVFDGTLTGPFASILGHLGRKRAWAIHGSAPGDIGMDEISLSGPTKIAEWDGTQSRFFDLNPADLGLEPAGLEALRGGDPADNAKILTSILDGSERGPMRHIVALNAAAAFTICGLTKDIREGFHLAGEVLDDGRAMKKLQALREWSA